MSAEAATTGTGQTAMSIVSDEPTATETEQTVDTVPPEQVQPRQPADRVEAADTVPVR